MSTSKTSQDEELAKIDALIAQHTTEGVLEGPSLRYSSNSQQVRYGGDQSSTKMSSGSSVPSGGYRCHRCGEQGHFIQDCPMSGGDAVQPRVRQARGIPKTFLETVTEAEAAKRGGGFISAEGELVVMKTASTEERLRLVGPSVDVALQRTFGAQCWEECKKCLSCYLCQEVVKEPVIVTCCGELFCRSCIIRHIDTSVPVVLKQEDAIGNGTRICPQCEKPGLSLSTGVLRDNTIGSLFASFSASAPVELAKKSNNMTNDDSSLPTARAKSAAPVPDFAVDVDANLVGPNVVPWQIPPTSVLVPGGTRNPFFSENAPMLSERDFLKWKTLFRDALERSGFKHLLDT